MLVVFSHTGCSTRDASTAGDAGDDAFSDAPPGDARFRPPPGPADACAPVAAHPAPADAASPCPDIIPGLHDTCWDRGVSCEYGDLPGPRCDSIYTCDLALGV